MRWSLDCITPNIWLLVREEQEEEEEEETHLTHERLIFICMYACMHMHASLPRERE